MMANDQGIKKAVFQEVILRLSYRQYNPETKAFESGDIDKILEDCEKVYRWIVKND